MDKRRKWYKLLTFRNNYYQTKIRVRARIIGENTFELSPEQVFKMRKTLCQSIVGDCLSFGGILGQRGPGNPKIITASEKDDGTVIIHINPEGGYQ